MSARLSGRNGILTAPLIGKARGEAVAGGNEIEYDRARAVSEGSRREVRAGEREVGYAIGATKVC